MAARKDCSMLKEKVKVDNGDRDLCKNKHKGREKETLLF